jgi:hypothetical protein
MGRGLRSLGRPVEGGGDLSIEGPRVARCSWVLSCNLQSASRLEMPRIAFFVLRMSGKWLQGMLKGWGLPVHEKRPADLAPLQGLLEDDRSQERPVQPGARIHMLCGRDGAWRSIAKR